MTKQVAQQRQEIITNVRSHFTGGELYTIDSEPNNKHTKKLKRIIRNECLKNDVKNISVIFSIMGIK